VVASKWKAAAEVNSRETGRKRESKDAPSQKNSLPPLLNL